LETADISKSAMIPTQGFTYKQEKQLTVRELTLLLYKCNQEALVYTDGCDCTGHANGVSFDERSSVYITRSN